MTMCGQFATGKNDSRPDNIIDNIVVIMDVWCETLDSYRLRGLYTGSEPALLHGWRC